MLMTSNKRCQFQTNNPTTIYAKLSRLRVYMYIDICAGYRYRLSEGVAVCVCVLGGGCSRCDNRPAIVSYIKSRLRCVAETETRACLAESVCGGCCQSLFRFTCRSAAMSHRQRIKRCDSNPRCYFPSFPPTPSSCLPFKCTLQQCKTNTRATTKPIVIAL